MISRLSRRLRRLIGSRTLDTRRRISPRDGHQSIRVELLEQRQLLTAGDLDPTFGVGGHVETEYVTSTEASKAFASVEQSDGKIIAAGEGGIARLLPNGSLDTTFGVGGQVQYPYFARSIALQTNGSFVVAGATSTVGKPRFVVSRYLSNGTIDTSFDTDGHAQLSFGGTSEYATDIAVQTNGRLVVVGVSDSRIAVARLTAAGSLDTTFSGDGLLLKAIYSTRNEASAVAIQSDGKIVMVGSFRPTGSSRSNLLLTRVDAASPAGPSTTVFVAANGQIPIRDNWSRDESLRLQVFGTDLQVQDLTGDSLATLSVSGLPEVTGTGTKTVLIPLSHIQQTNLPLLLDTRAGDDMVTLTSEVSDAGPVNITVAAGLGMDTLIQTSNTLGAIWNLNSAGSGSVKPDGIATPRAFSRVEHFVGGPLTDEFRVQAGTTPTWMLIDGVAGANDLIQITGDADMKLTNKLAKLQSGITQKITIANFERATLNGGV
jgi:uncharacterized delta-60 repeat protein